MKQQLTTTVIMTVLSLLCTAVNAQDKAIVRGTINDTKGLALQAATISLLRSTDSSFVKAGLADEKGNFEIAGAAAGSYLLSFTAIGFETGFSSPFDLKQGQSYQLPAVQLQPAAKQLQSATVTASRSASKSPLQVKHDKIVFNVASSISASGSNGMELLQKMPGIQVDDKGNISMKGKRGVKIYVDGRMTQLTSEDLAAYLKSINSNDVDAIEIISSPGARYDASGNAGVINIKLKKNSAQGMNGSVTAGLVQGITPKGNAAANVNYRNNKWNVFSNASFNTGQNRMDIVAPRSLKGVDYDQRLSIVSDTRNYSIKAGADYFIDSKQTIGIIATGNINQDDWFSRSSTDFYDPKAGQHTTLLSLNNTPRKRTSFNTNLNYRFADSSGREVNFDADYGQFRGRATSYLPNYYSSKGTPLSEVITLNNTPTDIDIYTAKTDVVLPLAKGSIGFGAKISYVTTQNTSAFFDATDGQPIALTERSFNFSYKENVNAAYVSYQRSINAKWSLQAGLRAEQTNTKGLLTRFDGVVQPDNDVKRSYLDFFPNATITYVADKKNTFNLSFTRRIDRPVYQDLNPFELKLDELTYLKGNSFLRPQYTNTVGLSHTWKNTITTSLEYSHVKDFTTEITDTLGNITFAQQRNIATQDIISLSISAPFQVSKNWRAFVSAWGNHQSFAGQSGNNTVDVKVYTYGASMQNTFTLGNEYSAEVTGWFNGPGLFGPTFRTRAMGSLDLGAQKLVMNGKGTVRIGVTDVLRTSSIWRARNEFGGLLLNVRAAMENRTAKITFTYRFGNNNVKASRNRETGLESEKNRIKTK
jgi:iron complex outermembrane receptor protein